MKERGKERITERNIDTPKQIVTKDSTTENKNHVDNLQKLNVNGTPNGF